MIGLEAVICCRMRTEGMVQSKEGKSSIDDDCKRKKGQANEAASTIAGPVYFEVGLTRAPSSMGSGVLVPAMASMGQVKSATLPNSP